MTFNRKTIFQLLDSNEYLYLPLEIVIREHDGKCVLAHEAATEVGK